MRSSEPILEVTLREGSARVSPVVTIVEQMDHEVVMRGSPSDLDEMARYLVSLGLPFTVRIPVQLREALHHLAATTTVQAAWRATVE